MDLLIACPFRSLLTVFFAVPIGVIVGIYGAELVSGLRPQGWHLHHR